MIQGQDQFDFWYNTLKLHNGFEKYTPYQLLKLAFVAGRGSIKEESVDVSFCNGEDVDDLVVALVFSDDKFDERHPEFSDFKVPMLEDSLPPEKVAEMKKEISKKKAQYDRDIQSQ